MSFHLDPTTLEEFKTFLFEEGVPYRDGRGEWQVLQFRDMSRKDEWFCVYSNSRNEEYKVDRRAAFIFTKFCNWKRMYAFRT